VLQENRGKQEKIIKKVRKIADNFKLVDKYVCEKDRIWRGK
jgi:hypothetical protein